ncbi:hypothetical protein [Gorillibacterium sp. sgz5001074]|uniref:hypothetical protein n=1 Tax=Gorillibacterium sp. sgz5001074 TaxID=3446695 RepID=UPI003F67B4F8
MANKISLAEAVKMKLAQKKAEAAAGSKQQKNGPQANQTMRNQINKKPNNQKRRTGV